MGNVRKTGWVVLASVGALLLLTGCGGAATQQTAPPTSGASNHTPTIAGTPGTQAVAGSPYSFSPSATDPDGGSVTFSIAQKPAWASFSTATGTLTGTPSAADAGTFSNIVVSVSNATTTVSLPAFSITVSLPANAGAGTGTAALSWSSPTRNSDGSALTNLGGYRVYHGLSSVALNDVRSVNAPGTTSFSFTGLASGVHYFAVTAISADGIESALSEILSKTIP